MKACTALNWLFSAQLALLQSYDVKADLIGIPTITFKRAGNGSLDLHAVNSIIVDKRFTNSIDQNGETLIPPTLLEFANTFRSDLSSIGIDIPLQTTGPHMSQTSLHLTLINNTGFVDAAGRFTSEAYLLNVTKSGITIAGASPLGVWWGTRTLLQLVTLDNGKIPIGFGIDSPGWGTRGIMLDVARHFYPIDFLEEMCAYISYFKQNTFHLHLSDNLFTLTTEQKQHVYAAFRLNSTSPDLAGLAKRPNETYTQNEFDDLQHSCASRGVTVIPEIEAPGHALVITQWKPQLAIPNDATLLNITFPDTIPTMKRMWKEFLPWFHSKTVHIGADEYDSALADDYNLFVNTMSSFIFQESGKKIRIWGTNEPGKHSTVSTNITIQHWDFADDNPLFGLLDKGYRVLNSDDSFYIVAGFSEYFPQSLNLTRIFHGDPSKKGGGPFAPYIFDVHNATNNPTRSNPDVVGHIVAQWNDFGPNATTVLQAYYDWRSGLPALADKQWGGNLSQDEFSAIMAKLQGNEGGKVLIPGQNLDRTITSDSTTILKYDFADDDLVLGSDGSILSIHDRSGNGYDAQVHNATVSNGTMIFTGLDSFMTTPLTSKGFNYTLSFSVNPSPPASGGGIGTILSGPDSMLLNGPSSGSSTSPFHNLTFFTSGNYYSLNYTLPTSQWTKLTFIGSSDLSTTLRVETLDGLAPGSEFETRFLAVIGVYGKFNVWKDIPIVAPLARIGGFMGQIRNFTLMSVVI